MADNFPNRIEHVPYTYAETIVASAVLASMSSDARDLLTQTLTDDLRAQIEGLVSQIDTWQTWLATNRPEPPGGATSEAKIQKFDQLVFADQPDMERRLTLFKNAVRRKNRVGFWLPLAGLTAFGAAIWYAAKR